MLYKCERLPKGGYIHRWYYLCNDGHVVHGSYRTMSEHPSNELDQEIKAIIKEQVKERGWEPRST